MYAHKRQAHVRRVARCSVICKFSMKKLHQRQLARKINYTSSYHRNQSYFCTNSRHIKTWICELWNEGCGGTGIKYEWCMRAYGKVCSIEGEVPHCWSPHPSDGGGSDFRNYTYYYIFVRFCELNYKRHTLACEMIGIEYFARARLQSPPVARSNINNILLICRTSLFCSQTLYINYCMYYSINYIFPRLFLPYFPWQIIWFKNMKIKTSLAPVTERYIELTEEKKF